MRKVFVYGIMILVTCATGLCDSLIGNDFIESEFENLHPPKTLSASRYDAHIDSDGDGWSNYAEARYSSVVSNASPSSFNEYPVPTLNLKVTYDGWNFSEHLVVNVYRDSSMQGEPTAVFNISLGRQEKQYNLELKQPTTGYLVEGPCAIFAYLDLNQNENWDAGEPCGVSFMSRTPVVLNIGWSQNSAEITLCDFRKDYFRFDFKVGLRTEDVLFGGNAGLPIEKDLKSFRVRMQKQASSGSSIILDKLLTNRDYLHEGDFIRRSKSTTGNMLFGFNYGLQADSTNAIYKIYVGTENVLTNNLLVYTYTNQMSTVLDNGAEYPAPTTISPINYEKVYEATPVFKWSMHEDFSSFYLTIKKGSSLGPTVYQSNVLSVPTRNVSDGTYEFRPDLFANNTLSSGHVFTTDTIYWYRFAGGDSTKFNDELGGGAVNYKFSDWASFNLATALTVTSNETDYCIVPVVVRYSDPPQGLSDMQCVLYVLAYDTPDFTGPIMGRFNMTINNTVLSTITNPENTTVTGNVVGLVPSAFANEYYFTAFIDFNNNNERDVFEPWGYSNYTGTNIIVSSSTKLFDTSVYRSLYGKMRAPYDPRSFSVSAGVTNTTVIIDIENCDTDNDGLSDIYEYFQNPSADFLSHQ